eukprot:PhF_6_TR28134/c0_g1_i1/m.41635
MAPDKFLSDIRSAIICLKRLDTNVQWWEQVAAEASKQENKDRSKPIPTGAAADGGGDAQKSNGWINELCHNGDDAGSVADPLTGLVADSPTICGVSSRLTALAETIKYLAEFTEKSLLTENGKRATYLKFLQHSVSERVVQLCVRLILSKGFVVGAVHVHCSHSNEASDNSPSTLCISTLLDAILQLVSTAAKSDVDKNGYKSPSTSWIAQWANEDYVSAILQQPEVSSALNQQEHHQHHQQQPTHSRAETGDIPIALDTMIYDDRHLDTNNTTMTNYYDAAEGFDEAMGDEYSYFDDISPFGYTTAADIMSSNNYADYGGNMWLSAVPYDPIAGHAPSSAAAALMSDGAFSNTNNANSTVTGISTKANPNWSALYLPQQAA